MAITAAQVKELRERTGSGMMECKKALVDAEGDMNAAIDALRKTGLAKADKKASRIAAEGLIVVETSDDSKTAAIVEVNCETDFVARKEDFQGFVSAIAKRVLSDNPADMDALMALPLKDGDAGTVEDARKAMIANVKTGDRVLLTSGILGQVRNVNETSLIIQIAEKTKIEVVKAAISQVLDEGETPSEIEPAK